MTRRRLVLIPLAVLPVLAACTARPETRPLTLDRVEFQNAGSTWSDALQLRRDGTYVLTHRRPSAARSEPGVAQGTWRLASPDRQLVILDAQRPVRLRHLPAAKQPWQFTPLAFVPGGTIPPGQQDQYVYVTGQYYLPKTALAAFAGEEPLGDLLTRP